MGFVNWKCDTYDGLKSGVGATTIPPASILGLPNTQIIPTIANIGRINLASKLGYPLHTDTDPYLLPSKSSTFYLKLVLHG